MAAAMARRIPTTDGPTCPAMREFDYIIVGAGSNGGVLGARLSENADLRVLLIEAEGRTDHWSIRMPAALASNFDGDPWNWCYHSVPQRYLAGRRESAESAYHQIFPPGAGMGRRGDSRRAFGCGDYAACAPRRIEARPERLDRVADLGVGFHLCAQELPYHPVGRRALVCSLEYRVLRIADDRTTPAINQHQLFLYSQCDFHVLPRSWTVGHTCAMMPAMRAPVPAVYNRAAAPDPAAARRHLRAGWRQSRHDSSGRGHNDNRQTV